MIIRLISVGKIREPFYRAGVQEYLKRLKPYVQIELLEGLDEKLNPRAGEKEIANVLAKEGQRVLGLIKDDEILAVLDVKSRALDSEGLAGWLDDLQCSGKTRITFLIGSAAGLSDEVRRRADYAISLSNLTLPHQMAALVLAEQIYRAFKIMRGEPYHK